MKKSLKDLKQVNGQKERKITNLDQFFNMGNYKRYDTLDLAVYTQKITEMNFTQLQNHAVSLGFMPIDDPIRLRKTLLEEFKLSTAEYKKPPQITTINKLSDLPTRSQKILSE